MTQSNNLEKYLPLSETSIYILLSLVQPLHGYGVMQHVQKISQGAVSIGPGTLYGSLSTFESEKLIEMVSETDRRKVYALTAKGKQVLRLQIQRLEIIVLNSREITHLL